MFPMLPDVIVHPVDGDIVHTVGGAVPHTAPKISVAVAVLVI